MFRSKDRGRIAIGVLFLALAAPTGLAGTTKEKPIRATLRASEAAFVASIFRPEQKDVEESLRALRDLRALHSRAMALWSRSFRRVDQASRAYVVGTSLTEYRGWPKIYREYVYRVARDEPAMVAVALGVDRDDVASLLAERSGENRRGAETSTAVAMFHCFLLRGDLQGLEHTLPRIDPADGASTESLTKAFADWKERPLDVVTRIELLERLSEIAGSRDLTLARIEMAWRCFDAANSDLERARVAFALASLAGQDWHLRWKGIEVARTFAIAAARFATIAGDWEHVVASAEMIAEAELADRHRTVAAAILETAAIDLGRSDSARRSAWRAIPLLRAQRRFEEAIRLLEQLLEEEEKALAGADPTARRHDSRRWIAVELARIHESRGEFRRAYAWLVAARYRYAISGGCGNCAEGIRKSLDAWMNRLARKF